MGAFARLPRAVHILCLGSFVVSAGMMVIPFLALYLSSHLGFSADDSIAALGAHGLGHIGGAFLGGSLADRFGRRPTMLLGLLASASAVTLLSELTGRASILAVITLFSLCGATFRPAASAMLSDLVSSADRPAAYSLMYAAGNLGFAFASIVGGSLAALSYRWLFLADAAGSVAYALLVLFAIRETRPVQPSSRQDVWSARDAWLHMLENRRFIRFGLATFLTALVFQQALSTLPFAMVQGGLDVSQYGRVMALNGMLIVLLQVPVTIGLERRNRASIVSIGDLLVAAGFGLTALCGSPIGFACSVVIWTLGEIIHAAFKPSVIGDLAPAELRARYFGAYQGIWGVAASIAPPIGGFVLTHFGGHWLWPACALIGLLASVLNVSLRRSLAA